MKNITIAFLGIFLVVFSFSACSATASKRSIGEVIDDAVITNKLKTRYMKDKGVKAHQIDIDTWKGVVSLRGRVQSQDQINRAIEIAERQPGVREVKSHLVVRGGDVMSPEPTKKKDRPADVEERDLTYPEVKNPEATQPPSEVVQD